MFDSRLPPDLREVSWFNVFFRMRNGDQFPVYRMTELMMASFCSYTSPAVADKKSNDIRTFHILILP